MNQRCAAETLAKPAVDRGCLRNILEARRLLALDFAAAWRPSINLLEHYAPRNNETRLAYVLKNPTRRP
jgi:hypothetical protein